mgnify:CR=1 FL=1
METNEKPKKGNRPAYEARVGLCRATVWQNQAKDGKTRYSIQLSRRYPVKSEGGDEWRTSDSFSPLDIPLVMQAAQQAFEFATARTKPVSEQLAEEADEADRVASISG